MKKSSGNEEIGPQSTLEEDDDNRSQKQKHPEEGKEVVVFQHDDVDWTTSEVKENQIFYRREENEKVGIERDDNRLIAIVIDLREKYQTV